MLQNIDFAASVGIRKLCGRKKFYDRKPIFLEETCSSRKKWALLSRNGCFFSTPTFEASPSLFFSEPQLHLSWPDNLFPHLLLLLTQGLIRENGSNWVSSPARNRISPPRPFHCLIIIIITIKSDVLLTDFEKKEMKRSETMLTKKVKACWSEGTQLDPADYSDLRNFSNFLHPSFPVAHNFYGDKSFLSIWLDFGGFKLRIQNVFTTTVELFSKFTWILVFRENSKIYWHAQRILFSLSNSWSARGWQQ